MSDFWIHEPAPWGSPHLKTSSPCYTPHSRINQWAHSFRELPLPAFSCLYDGVKTGSRCGDPLKKTQSHADPWVMPKKQSYVRIRHPLTPPLIHPSDFYHYRSHHNSEAWRAGTLLSHVLHCMFLNSIRKGWGHYQSTTGTISSSGWFPTTWSMKFSFPLGLHTSIQYISCRSDLIVLWTL